MSGASSSSSGGGSCGGGVASASGPAPPPALTQARGVLAAAAAGRASCSFRGTNVSASCVQTLPRGSSSGRSGAFQGVGGRQGGGGGGGKLVGAGEYGSAVVDVMGGGMETLTLPKLVLHGSGLREVGAREEAYAVLGRLGEL